MPFDGSGNFNRVMNWQNDATANVKIRADRHDQEDNNFAAGLSSAITKDGQTAITANIPMNGKRLTNLANPVNASDAATKSYADQIKSFSTGLVITGADANGRLTFSSATGANGLAFTGADLSWLARLKDSPAAGWQARMALNSKPDGSGTDVAFISDTGQINCDRIMGNTFYDATTPAWKAIIAGWTNQMDFDTATGSIFWYSSTATAAAGAAVTLTQTMSLNKDGDLSLHGDLTSAGRVKGNDVLSVGHVYANNGVTYLQTNGNVVSNASGVWASWGANDAFNAISKRIEARGAAFADDRISRLQYRKVSQGNSGVVANFICPAGAVVTGYSRDPGTNGQVGSLYFMYLQVYDPVRGWVGFSG